MGLSVNVLSAGASERADKRRVEIYGLTNSF